MKIAFVGAALMLGGLSAPTAIAQSPTNAPSDSALIQGRFVLVGGTVFGDSLSQADLTNSFRITIGDQLTVTIGGQLLLKATVRMDPSAQPKHMDYLVSAPAAGTSFAGLYQVRGDTLVLCFGRPNGPRPAAMVTGPDQTLFTWVRVRP